MRTFRKNIVRVEVVILTIAVIASSLALAQSFSEQKKADDFIFEWTVTFSFEELEFSQIMGYDLVSIVDGGHLTDIGMPMLPIKNIQLALPQDMKAVSIRILEKEELFLPGEYTIIPAQQPQYLSTSPEQIKLIEADSIIYLSSEYYPLEDIELLGQSDLAGQSLAEVCIYPVHYQPSNHQLILTTSIRFIIEGTAEYTYGDYLPMAISDQGRESYEQTISEMVENPQDVQLHSSDDAQPLGVPPGDYEYVIITQSTWVDDFQPLVDWKTKKGMPATIVTTTWIYSEYSGTNQQKIRAFVQDAHTTWGATFFLLGGDTNIVPYYTKYYLGEGIPTDTYYADYDDDWLCEVHVGRAPVQLTGTWGIDTFIDKVLTYERDPPLTNYAETAFFCGFDLYDYGSHEGENCKKDIKYYYLPGDWTYRSEYDSESGYHYTDVLNYLNQGNNLVNHADHSGTDFMGTGYTNNGLGLDTNDAKSRTNGDRQSIIYSMGCWPADYPDSECIAEGFIRNPNGGGVAFIGNSRSGWYNPNHDDTLSFKYDRYFFRSLFSQGHYHLGDCFSDHKRDAYLSMTQDDYNKYIFTELTLLGDPEMPIWTENPSTMSVIHPSTLPLGSSAFFVDTNVAYAYLCLWKDGDVYLTGTANSAGDYTFYPNPSTTGPLFITVTQQDYIPYEGTAEVVPGDIEPPLPNPMTWQIEPMGVSPTEIAMVSTTATDDTPPIKYYFDFYTGGAGGTDSDWQTSTTYLDSGLQPNTQYSYRVRAQDNVDPPNIGSYSSIVYVYTHANIPDIPSVSNPTTTTLDVEVNTNDNPTITQYAILCDSSNPYDATWDGKYIAANGDPSSSEVWQTESGWGIATVKNLNPDTTYCFAVKARNEDNIETEFSTAGCEQTLPEGQNYILTIIIEGNGNVDLNPDLPTYPDGTEVTLEGIGDAGWRLYHWSGDIDTYDNPTIIIMDDDKTVTAQFWRIGDTNGDDIVNVVDLLYLLASWGTDDPAADFNRDGTVNVNDLLDLLAHWG